MIPDNIFFRISLWFLLTGFAACTSRTSPALNDRKEQIEEMDEMSGEVTKSQTDRKLRSENLLQGKGIKINATLPYLKDEKNTTLRSAQEVARRATILTAVNHVAFGNFSEQEVTDYLVRYNLWDYTTEKEKQFLKNPTEEAKIQETWKVEGIWTLIWALNGIQELGFPVDPADLNTLPEEHYPFEGIDVDPNPFIERMKTLRSTNEILNAADLYYRMDWACVDARINHLEMKEIHPSVVYERHYALNWLIRYMNQDWDNITTDS